MGLSRRRLGRGQIGTCLGPATGREAPRDERTQSISLRLAYRGEWYLLSNSIGRPKADKSPAPPSPPDCCQLASPHPKVAAPAATTNMPRRPHFDAAGLALSWPDRRGQDVENDLSVLSARHLLLPPRRICLAQYLADMQDDKNEGRA